MHEKSIHHNFYFKYTSNFFKINICEKYFTYAFIPYNQGRSQVFIGGGPAGAIKIFQKQFFGKNRQTFKF